MKRIVVILSLMLFFIGGCAYTQANLDVAYNPEKTREGPLSSLKPLNIEIKEFLDKRPETDKIGYKRDGFGQKAAKIVTKKPVTQIVREAFVAAFKKNGHLIASGNKDISISGAITTFWFDTEMHFWTVEFMGTVSVDLKVVNGKTGEVLLTRTYEGHYNEKSTGGLQKTWERVINTALERIVRQVSTDPKLLKALQSI